MPTLKEIAKQAGVSPALISAYLNGRPSARMQPETRKRINAALRKTGYKPNPLARALRTGSSGIIGYLASSLQNEVSQREQVGFHEALAARGYRMMTRYTKNEYLLFMEGCQDLIHMGCDGLIINRVAYEEMLKYCLTLPVPVVGLGPEPDLAKYDFMITVDYRAGVEKALRHLVRTGRRHAVFLSHPLTDPEKEPRYSVYRENFPEGPCIFSSRKEMLNTAWIADILKRHPETDAFFCINDNCAIAVWGALNELGFRVPEDYALIGFDDLPAAASLRLASIRKPQREMVESAVALLESKLKKQPAEVSRIFPAEFIPRRSCMKISARNNKKGLVKA